jgi:hypothetical protein
MVKILGALRFAENKKEFEKVALSLSFKRTALNSEEDAIRQELEEKNRKKKKWKKIEKEWRVPISVKKAEGIILYVFGNISF